MKNYYRLLSMLGLIALLFSSACGDDDSDDPSVDPLVGVYTLTSVTLNQDVLYNGINFMDGDDITVIVTTALYDASPCDNGANTVIDLRDSFDVYYACKSETTDPERFGNWSLSSDRSTLTMNLTVQGSPFPLVLEDLVVTDTNVTGTVANYPLVELSPGGGFQIIPVSVDIDFTRTTL